LVDHNATLTLWRDGEIAQQWHGMISECSLGDTGHRHTVYQVHFVPPMMRLTLRHNSRIFQAQTVPEIISVIVQEMGIQDFAFALTRQYPKREYCVQYRELDLDFIQRIAAEEGIYFYFTHTNNKNTVIFADESKNASKLPEPVPYNALSSGVSAVPYVRQFQRHQRLRSASVQLKDRLFTNPAYSFLHT
ncbi:type VI secretion system tip protein VgrG, partial [Vibrio sp. S4M6]